MAANILLLRGLAREARHWGSFLKNLGTHPSFESILCLDLPGVGSEIARDTPAQVGPTVDDLRKRWFSQRQDNGLPWIVLGISFGGMIALDWSCRYPEDFQGVVIGNSSASNLGLPHERMTPKAMKHVLKSNLEKDPYKREKIVLDILSNDSRKRAAVAKSWGRIAAESPIRRGTFMRQLIAAASYKCPESCPVPVLILASPRDRFVDVRCSEKLAARLGGRLEYHPTAGHAITLDAPEWVSEKTADWIADLNRISA